LNSNKERRKHKRFEYIAVISHDASSNDIIHPGKMYNFSRGGLYFESDQTMYPGEEVFIGTISQAVSSDTHLLFEVKIIWQKELRDAPLRYGYGGKFLNSYDFFLKGGDSAKSRERPAADIDFNAENDSRKHRRRPYNKPMLFMYNNEEYEGLVTNISRGGAFVKTPIKLNLGEIIKLAIPTKDRGKDLEIFGWVVRICPGGVSLSFERRSGRERRSDLDRRTGLERRARKKRKRGY
jgi:Tfp pilus assembly protein PilZ